MYKLMSGAALVALMMATPAFAADLAVKAAPVAPILFSWTGCYVGGHVGGAVSEDRTTNRFGGSVGYSSAGFVGDGQVGCDYQFATSWVAGLEVRTGWSSLDKTHRAAVRFPAIGVVVPSQFTLVNDFLASTTERGSATALPIAGLFSSGAAAPGLAKRSTMLSSTLPGLPSTRT